MPVMHSSGRGVAGQRGASLIEVLVAILIVSMGVMAMAGLLAASTRLGKASEYRATASLLAADIADRMKANICGARGSYVNAGGTTVCGTAPATGSYDQTTAFSIPAPTPGADPACAVANACTPAEMAALDLAQWNRAVNTGLPNGMGYVQYDAAGIAVDVWVAWLDPNASSSADYDTIESKDLVSNRFLCPPGFRATSPKPRCVYLRVALT
jgi:type IV pilus assembly protein PilV